MKLSTTTLFYQLTIVIIFLPACVGQRLHHFPRIETTKIVAQEKEGLKVTLSRFNSAESSAYFGTDLNYYGYLPLHIRIHNASNSIYIMKATEIELSLVSPKKIAELLYHDTRSFFIWTTIPSVIFAWPLLGITLPATFAMGYDNKHITDNLADKSLKRKEVIEIHPRETIDKFIFTYEEDLPQYSNISFIKKRTESWLTFYVDFSQEIKK